MTEVHVILPETLKSLAGNQETLVVDAGTIAEVFDLLEERCPDLIRLLKAKDGSLRRYVNVYINQDDIRSKAGLNTTLHSGDQIRILPSVAGG